MIVCELSVVPIGTGNASVSSYVAEAVKVLEREGFNPENRAMATEFEAETVEEACRAMRAAHKAVLDAGAGRVVTSLKIDERKDKEHSLSGKIQSVDEKK